MELEQLIPEKASLTKKVNAGGKESEIVLNFRPFNVEDESWLKRAFGDKLQKHFENMDMEVISRIAFHQLEIESKRKIMSIKFIDIDEDGEEIEVAKTGPKKVAQMTEGYNEQYELLKILLKIRGFSLPIVEEITSHLDKEGKKKTGKSKKGRKKKSTGSKFST